MTVSEIIVHCIFWGVLVIFQGAHIYWFVYPKYLTPERMVWSGALVIVALAAPVIINAK